jgi:ATP synthase protein I
VTLIIAAFCLLIDLVTAYSSLLGGLACVLPGVYAVIRLNRVSAQTDVPPETGLKQVLFGELGKLALTIVVFIMVFMWVKPLVMASFFGTFVGLQCLNILIPVLDSRRLRSRR